MQYKSRSKSEFNTSSDEKIKSEEKPSQIQPRVSELGNETSGNRFLTSNEMANQYYSETKLQSGNLSKSDDGASKKISRGKTLQGSTIAQIDQQLNEDLNSDSSQSNNDSSSSDQDIQRVSKANVPTQLLEDLQSDTSSNDEEEGESVVLNLPPPLIQNPCISNPKVNSSLAEDLNSCSDSDDSSSVGERAKPQKNSEILPQSSQLRSMLVHQHQNLKTPCFQNSNTQDVSPNHRLK